MTSHEYKDMMFSLDDFAHLKIPLENILSATNNFSNLYFCGKNAFQTYYEVQLLWSGELITIIAGRLNKECFDGEQQFWMEVSLLSTLKHKNLVSFVGFCDENDEKVTIIKKETGGSLLWHLSDPMLLTWVRRLEISVGIAQALSYIHYDESRDFSVIHRNINSLLIYLNDDWEPKLGDFICSMKIKASERHQSFNTNEVRSTDGYTDPTCIETKSVSHKSDMYSFGIVMFELLCGRKSVEANDYNKYLAPVAITHYREQKLNEIIDWSLWQQMDSQSFNMFAEIAHDCLKEERSQRPNINEIVPRLVKALELARENMPPRKDNGCGYFMWNDAFDEYLRTISAPTECSSCHEKDLRISLLETQKHVLETRIRVLEAKLEMATIPDDHACQSDALLHELLGDMDNLRM